MDTLGYRVVFTPDDNDTLLVTCPDLPEVTTFGEDEGDALLRARDAIDTALAYRMSTGTIFRSRRAVRDHMCPCRLPRL